MNRNLPRLFPLLLIVMLMAGCSVAPTANQPRQAVTPAKVSPQPARETVYLVQAGDTLSAIGRRFAVTSLQIQYRNNITDPRKLKIGTRLVIPHKNQQVPQTFVGKAAFIWPLRHLDVSSEFGSRNGRHKGIDLRAPTGTSIYAAADGVVHFSGRQRGYGKVIILKHENNVQTFYAHNNKNMVSKGQRIRQGELIARVGRTGNASGSHLHFEYVQGRQRLNPRDYLGQ